MDGYALGVPLTLCIASGGVLVGVLLTLQTWEHARFVRRAGRRIDLEPATPGSCRTAAVIVPVRGLEPGLEENLRGFFQQDYENYQLVFVGEDPGDPAHAVVAALRQRFPGRKAQWLSVGRAAKCGQKVHNLLRATAALGDDVEFLAFADSDAQTGPDWLTHLIGRLESDPARVRVATGYRCLVPRRPSLANATLCALNSAVTAWLSGRSMHNMIWGGSWAIRRADFNGCELPRLWEGTLSDDVVATRAVRRQGWRIGFHPRLLATSEVDFTFRGLGEFLRRQFFMVRHYAPRAYWLALTGWTLHLAVFWGGLAVAAGGWLLAQPVWLASGASVAAVHYAGTVLRAKMRQRALRRCLPQLPEAVRRTWSCETWAAPWVNLVGWSCMVAALWGNRVTWRAIRYRLDGRGRVAATQWLGGASSTAPQPTIESRPDRAEQQPLPDRAEQQRRAA